MPDRPKAISVQIDDRAGCVTFALRGLVHGNDLLDVTAQTFNGSAEPWPDIAARRFDRPAEAILWLTGDLAADQVAA